jgi:RNA polymerase sigma-70 factor (ECF subfamily)
MQRTPQAEAAEEQLGRLLSRCAAGDPDAWRDLVAGQHRRIYALCYRFTGSASDAEDLTQEVFLKLVRNLRSFDCERGRFSTWIATMTRNLLVDHYRRTRLERASQSLDAVCTNEDDGGGSMTLADRLADPRPSQQAHVSGVELKLNIQKALSQLPPDLREAVILRDIEDMDYKDIADMLIVPRGTIKSRISRGRRELARLLHRIEGQVV